MDVNFALKMLRIDVESSLRLARGYVEGYRADNTMVVGLQLQYIKNDFQRILDQLNNVIVED